MLDPRIAYNDLNVTNEILGRQGVIDIKESVVRSRDGDERDIQQPITEVA
jgi:hypothetical protein